MNVTIPKEQYDLLIQKAEERDMVVNNSATSSQIGQIIAERDSYKQKADALDWLEKNRPRATYGDTTGYVTIWKQGTTSIIGIGETLLSAIQQAQKGQDCQRTLCRTLHRPANGHRTTQIE